MSGDVLINSLFVFMLAGFVGFQVIKRVSPLLHTPLMSLTNALDAIAVVGTLGAVSGHSPHLSWRARFTAREGWARTAMQRRETRLFSARRRGPGLLRA